MIVRVYRVGEIGCLVGKLPATQGVSGVRQDSPLARLRTGWEKFVAPTAIAAMTTT